MNSLSAKSALFCECISSVFIAPDIAALEFDWPGLPPRAGQFFLIKPRCSGVFLGRPISVAGWKQQAGEDGGVLRFLVALKGRGSRELADLMPGEEAELIGPLGNSWAKAGIPGNKPKGPLALVGGGIGIAPLLALTRELGKNPFDFYAGFRSGSFGLKNIKPRPV